MVAPRQVYTSTGEAIRVGDVVDYFLYQADVEEITCIRDLQSCVQNKDNG